jgi:hypothetical protein
MSYQLDVVFTLARPVAASLAPLFGIVVVAVRIRV